MAQRTHAAPAPNDPAPPVIRVSIRNPEQLFNSIDPSPFYYRDLDESAERFIMNWARDVPRSAPLELHLSIDRHDAQDDGAEQMTEAVHEQFRRRSETVSREVRELLRNGRIAVVIGLAFLTVSVVVGDLIGRWMGETYSAHVLQQGLVLLGWVAMWRPIEIFLYGWWPLLRERRLYDRLGHMPIRVDYRGKTEGGQQL